MRLDGSTLVVFGCLLAACGGTTAEGDWEGVCEIDTEGYEADLEFEMRVDTDKGGRLDGEGAYLYEGYIFDGRLTGSRDGNDARFTVEGEYGGYTVKLELDGVIDGDDAEGTCRFGGGRGTFSMDR